MISPSKRKTAKPSPRATRGRPLVYEPHTKVALRPTGRSKLQPRSVRKRIVELMIENGGVMTFEHIDRAMGWDCRSVVIALIRAGWLKPEDER